MHRFDDFDNSRSGRMNRFSTNPLAQSTMERYDHYSSRRGSNELNIQQSVTDYDLEYMEELELN